jgi:3-oxoacyl-[acyl-carrier protein] reductase
MATSRGGPLPHTTPPRLAYMYISASTHEAQRQKRGGGRRGARAGLRRSAARAGGGAQVYAVARRREHLEPLAALGIRTGAFDLSKAAAAAEAAERELGRVDGLAITAGGWAPGRLDETEEEVLDSMLSVNLRAHLWTVKSFLKLMRPGSAVALVTSIWGPVKRSPGALAYTVSKAAAAPLVETLAAELLERGIRVNGVAPGAMAREAEAAKLGAPAAPPEYVADVVLWLLTDEARWVTGALIPVGGGRRLITP